MIRSGNVGGRGVVNEPEPDQQSDVRRDEMQAAVRNVTGPFKPNPPCIRGLVANNQFASGTSVPVITQKALRMRRLT